MLVSVMHLENRQFFGTSCAPRSSVVEKFAIEAKKRRPICRAIADHQRYHPLPPPRFANDRLVSRIGSSESDTIWVVGP